MADQDGALTDILESSANEPLSVSIIGTLPTARLRLDRAEVVSEKIGQPSDSMCRERTRDVQPQAHPHRQSL